MILILINSFCSTLLIVIIIVMMHNFELGYNFYIMLLDKIAMTRDSSCRSHHAAQLIKYIFSRVGSVSSC